VSWDGFQREVLAELGLAAYALVVDAGGQQVEPGAGETAISPLLAALLRAAAAGVDDAQALALCQTFLAAHPAPSVQERRALWPQLRRLRARRTA